jgi:hypothetical protein
MNQFLQDIGSIAKKVSKWLNGWKTTVQFPARKGIFLLTFILPPYLN